MLFHLVVSFKLLTLNSELPSSNLKFRSEHNKWLSLLASKLGNIQTRTKSRSRTGDKTGTRKLSAFCVSAKRRNKGKSIDIGAQEVSVEVATRATRRTTITTIRNNKETELTNFSWLK